MKPGRRALGIAESFGSNAETSTLAGAVVRADRVVDGLQFGSCTVGGTDSTQAISDLYATFDREDIRYVLLSGVALAWYNIVTLDTIATRTGCPVLAVTYEESTGLEDPLRAAFDGDALDRRLQRYRQLPPRWALSVNGTTVYVRAVDLDRETARRVLRAYTPEGGRPEPLRVARLAARGAREFRGD